MEMSSSRGRYANSIHLAGNVNFSQSHHYPRNITESLAEQSSGHTPTLARFRSGAKVMYLGHPRLLNIKNGTQNRIVQHDTHTISVEVTAIPFSPAAEALAAEAVESWKRTETERICGMLAAEYAANIGLPPPPVRAMQSNRYWGLCETDGTLKFDWRLVEQEPRQIEKIVAHEVAHLVERNHGERFAQLVGQMCLVRELHGKSTNVILPQERV